MVFAKCVCISQLFLLNVAKLISLKAQTIFLTGKSQRKLVNRKGLKGKISHAKKSSIIQRFRDYFCSGNVTSEVTTVTSSLEIPIMFLLVLDYFRQKPLKRINWFIFQFDKSDSADQNLHNIHAKGPQKWLFRENIGLLNLL